MKSRFLRHLSLTVLVLAVLWLTVLLLVRSSDASQASSQPTQTLTGPLSLQAASSISQNVEMVAQLGGTMNTVAMQGNLAYVGIGPSLVIFNIANPAHLAVLGQSSPMPDVIANVVVSGTFAYVADNNGGLRIVDVSDPANPREIGAWRGTAFCVAVVGQYAYVGEGQGMHVIDVSNPASPQHTGFIDTVRGVYSLAAAGYYAYVGATRNIGDYHIGLWVMDVSDPAQPQVTGYVPDVRPFGVALAGNYAYIAEVGYGLRIIDIADPVHPTRVGSCYTPGAATNVAVADHYAYVADGDGLSIIDISEPLTPTQTAYYSMTGGIVDVAVTGNVAYATAREGGLHAVNIANPADPHQVGYYESLVSPSSVAVAGVFAYVTEDDPYGGGPRGLRIVNVSEPAHPFRVGVVDMPGRARDVAVAGPYVYSADDNAGLRVVNALYATSPAEISSVGTPGQALGVAVSGDYAYVADGSGGLRIIKVKNPADPSEVGAYDTPGNAQDVTVRGSMAYVADGSAGLRLISVANPSAPTEVGFYDTPGDAQGVAVVGDYAYVADGVGGLRIISVTDTAHPSEVGSITPDSIGAVAVTSDGLAYVTNGYDGSLYVINVTDPAHPVQVGFYQMSGNAQGLAIADGLAYVADGDGGLMILRYRPGSLAASFIANPTSGRPPLTVAFTDTSTGEVDSRLWSFGDGVTSTLTNPTHTYTSRGAYTVTLAVSGPGGDAMDIKPSFIAVLEPAAYLPLVMRDYSSILAASLRFVASSGTDTGNDCRNDAAPCASVQHAVDAAHPGDEIRVAAGTYTDLAVRPRSDVTTTGVVTQVVYVSKTVTILGGYTTTNWNVPDPAANLTVLDAQGRGRVLYIVGDTRTLVISSEMFKAILRDRPEVSLAVMRGLSRRLREQR